MKNLFIGLTLLAAALFTGCEDGACCNGESLQENSIDERGNITPIANFDNITIVSTGTNCTFNANGAASSDSDGNVDTYSWSVDGTAVSTSINPVDITVPCSTEPQIVCLTVTDNDGASSLEKCISVEVTDNTPTSQPEPTPQPEPETGLIPPEAVITFAQFGDEEAHTFSCESSFDKDAVDSDNAPADDPKVISCHWEVFKTLIDGSTTVPHTQDGFTKWIATPADEFSSLHVTLTVVDDDGQSTTITKSYALPQDLN